MHTVDAHGSFPPSSAASTVPLWRFIPSNSWVAVFRRPFSFFSSALFRSACGGAIKEARGRVPTGGVARR
ncbi:hypothetical protein CDO30_18765 (plasmid) [Sinorhizobium meliloti]|nr:hypothetical protein CDO30_18765 [Sinorhizobium meliloti]RVL37660.1 hypothetical protein CN146_31555 [Sinorhizobium meliloti]RVN07948.1 hypothetical protein CN115_23775 [Sinorhizobium meliloti]RVN18762.1 hypothetical protein CN114_25085 [Sinorhizobium meliloti]RVO01652.1 hypothetical protein CN099_29015 [Sinorhizobium meliloti]